MRKRPLNKKELAKNEEDIIETLSNSLVVHETKLKVTITLFCPLQGQDYTILERSNKSIGIQMNPENLQYIFPNFMP